MIPLAATTRISAPRVAQFTPKSIAGCKLWWEARAISANDGDAMASVTDLSGNGTSTTATGTAKPLFKTNIINGNPALLFDGVDDRFSVGSITIGTLVIAAKYNAATFASYDGLWGEDVAGNSPFYFTGTGGGTDWFTGFPFPATATQYKDDVASSTSVTNAWHVFSVVDSSPLTSVWEIGEDRQNASRFWNGYVYGVAAYDTALSNANRKQVEQYFGAQIGVSIP